MGITIFLFCLIGIVALACAGLAFRKKMKQNDAAEVVLFMAGMSLIVGLFSYTLHMYHAAKAGIVSGNAFFAIITTVPDSVEQSRQISNAFSTGSLLIMATLVFTVICALLWQFLRHVELKH
jgi:hypothetical protein